MSTPRTSWTGRAAGAALAAAAVVLAGCSPSDGAAGRGTTGAVAGAPERTGPSSAASVRVVLRVGDHAVGATLADTPASRELAGMLPMTVELSDAWGQAMAGRLPHPVTIEGAARTVEPVPGGIYFWPDTATLAVYCNDLGQSVPPPGLIQLGAIDAGVGAIADAGRHVAVRIERAAHVDRSRTPSGAPGAMLPVSVPAGAT